MTQHSRLTNFVREKGFVRVRDLLELGIHRETLRRMVASGELDRVARGLYRLSDCPVTEYHSLALVAKKVDGVVVCLLSALAFHEITTQLPTAVWVAIASGRTAPKLEWPVLEVTYMSDETLLFGAASHHLEGVEVRVTTPAKTVADCFKYRNKIGIDVAVEALKDYWVQRKGTIEDLIAAARVCRVSSVIRPYLEAVVG